ncbi:MAG: hypothetical protein IKN49_02040 [Elusimicrobiaceae bacterium]|nr:hypothetical protein [Elusimicrobiaceae bacterium]
MHEEKLKQLELLISQTASRLQTLQRDVLAARQKIRQQEETIARLRQNETELKTLREWKRTTISTLKKLETRLDKEIAKASEQNNELV